MVMFSCTDNLPSEAAARRSIQRMIDTAIIALREPVKIREINQDNQWPTFQEEEMTRMRKEKEWEIAQDKHDELRREREEMLKHLVTKVVCNRCGHEHKCEGGKE